MANLTQGEPFRLSASIPLVQLIAMAGAIEPRDVVTALLGWIGTKD